ncbi:MAG TPA: tetratricopeptide repeat protein [Verrucomicrobiae bacterium]|nr:tetratricopeptide repeat protein [Verrucomicrobiae bacterium]
MSPLPPPDSHHLLAAIGWLELGNHGEAFDELQKLAAKHRDHPDVLEVRWDIYHRARNWGLALEAARELVRRAPDRVNGWVHQAYSLRRVEGGGLQAAWDALHPAVARFPKEPIIPYNLACYLAKLNRLDEAWEWLKRAVTAAGGPSPIRKLAQGDPDLEVFWSRLEELGG